MIARPFGVADLPAASAIINMHPMMYGTPIDNSAYIAGLTNVTPDNFSISIMDGDKLFGVARQHWWEGLPIWSVGSMFFNEVRNNQQVLQAGKALFTFMTERAEAEGRYDFYYIVRDAESARKNMSLMVNPDFAQKYDLIDVEVIPPLAHAKYRVFSNMLGNLSGKNTKTLVVRHGYLRPEFRQDVWKKT